MSVLKNLPYDLQPYLFRDLDQQTLLNACLASRALNELASWALYSQIILNDKHKYPKSGRRQPFEAFFRRPGLRNAVVEVTVHFTLSWQPISRWNEEDGPQLWLKCSEELSKMPNLKTIRIAHNYSYHENRKLEYDLLFDIIASLPSVRWLHMHDIPYTYTERVMHIPNIAVVGNEYGLQKAQKSPLNSRIKEYRMKFMTWSTSCLEQFSHLTSLTTLELGGNEETLPRGVFEILRAMPELQNLTIVCAFPEDSYFEPIQLKRLEFLKVVMRWTSTERVKNVCRLIECLAGESHLKSLVIQNNRERQAEYSGDCWLLPIIRRHAATLVELKIQQFHPNLQVASITFGRCPNLELLWVGVNQQLQRSLADLISMANKLRKIKLLLRHSAQGDIQQWVMGNSVVLLFQSNKCLQEVKIYISGRERQRVYKTGWKGGWKFDSFNNCAMRWIKGPAEAKAPPRRRGGDMTAYDSDGNYHYEDPSDYHNYSE